MSETKKSYTQTLKSFSSTFWVGNLLQLTERWAYFSIFSLLALYLVAGTDNAAELHTGYFTKHGDGGVDFLPIANLTKGEVFEWAKELGIHEDLINKAPSAGLWEGQTDESEMGTSYKYIDMVLEGKADQVPEKDKAIIDRLHRVSEHKRVPAARPPIFE